MNDELKPCLWCSHDKISLQKKFDGGLVEGDEDFFYWMECDYCGAQGPTSATKGKAADAWNHRTDDSRISTLEKKLEEAVKAMDYVLDSYSQRIDVDKIHPAIVLKNALSKIRDEKQD